MVEEVGSASAAVEVPGDDGVLGSGVDAAAPAPEHALPLEPLHEQQPHPRKRTTASRHCPANRRIDQAIGAQLRRRPLSPSQRPRIEKENTQGRKTGEGRAAAAKQGTGPGSGYQERKKDEEPFLSLKGWLPKGEMQLWMMGSGKVKER